MRILAFCLVLSLAGCGSGPQSPEGYLTEQPGPLPPDRTALRVAQQFAPAGVSHQTRLLLLDEALMKRNKAPNTQWDVKPEGATFVVTATLSANDRPPTTFLWKVDFSKPPASVCQPLNQEASLLGRIHIKLDEEGLEKFLEGPAATPAAPATP